MTSSAGVGGRGAGGWSREIRVEEVRRAGSDAEVPGSRGHRDRQPVPGRGCRRSGAGRRRSLPGVQRAPAAQLGAARPRPRDARRGRRHPCPPRPLGLPASARARRLRRSHRLHPGDRRPGGDRAARQRPPPGGGRALRERGGILQAPPGPSALRPRRRREDPSADAAREVRRAGHPRRRDRGDLAPRRSHPRLRHRAGRGRRLPGALQRRPRPAAPPPAPATSRPAPGRRDRGRVHLRRPGPPASRTTSCSRTRSAAR